MNKSEYFFILSTIFLAASMIISQSFWLSITMGFAYLAFSILMVSDEEETETIKSKRPLKAQNGKKR